MPDWAAIHDILAGSGIRVDSRQSPRPVAGGDINEAWRLDADSTSLFLKTGPASAHDMYLAEADGLAEISATGAVRVPRVVAVGTTGHDAFLALEWLDIERPTAASDQKLGVELAALHRVTARQFGWQRDNTIGRTPQPNPWTDDWVRFFREHRLRVQLELAAEGGHRGEIQSLGRQLCDALPSFFDGYDVIPSLLHGDLWGGNRAAIDNEPVIFDPATYYGDRESDLAMTMLFGRFNAAFYEAYEAAWPLANGHERRVELYQLYHLHNHLNLFGSGYAGSVLRCLHSLCRDV